MPYMRENSGRAAVCCELATNNEIEISAVGKTSARVLPARTRRLQVHGMDRSPPIRDYAKAEESERCPLLRIHALPCTRVAGERLAAPHLPVHIALTRKCHRTGDQRRPTTTNDRCDGNDNRIRYNL